MKSPIGSVSSAVMIYRDVMYDVTLTLLYYLL